MMKTTGIIRRMDDLGRVVIPKEVRKKLKIDVGEPLEVFFDEKEKIVCFQKYIENNNIENLKEQFMNLTKDEKNMFLKEISSIDK